MGGQRHTARPAPFRHSRHPHRHSRESGNPHPAIDHPPAIPIPPFPPPPSFRRRPESRTPVRPGGWIPAFAGMTVGGGNDGMRGCGNDGMGAPTKKPPFRKRGVGGITPGPCNAQRRPKFARLFRPPLPGFWIPACAGMTVGMMGICKVGGLWRFSLTQPSPAGRGPAAGATTPPGRIQRHRYAQDSAGVLDSRFRGNDDMGGRE